MRSIRHPGDGTARSETRTESPADHNRTGTETGAACGLLGERRHVVIGVAEVFATRPVNRAGHLDRGGGARRGGTSRLALERRHAAFQGLVSGNAAVTAAVVTAYTLLGAGRTDTRLPQRRRGPRAARDDLTVDRRSASLRRKWPLKQAFPMGTGTRRSPSWQRSSRRCAGWVAVPALPVQPGGRTFATRKSRPRIRDRWRHERSAQGIAG